MKIRFVCFAACLYAFANPRPVWDRRRLLLCFVARGSPVHMLTDSGGEAGRQGRRAAHSIPNNLKGGTATRQKKGRQFYAHKRQNVICRKEGFGFQLRAPSIQRVVLVFHNKKTKSWMLDVDMDVGVSHDC